MKEQSPHHSLRQGPNYPSQAEIPKTRVQKQNQAETKKPKSSKCQQAYHSRSCGITAGWPAVFCHRWGAAIPISLTGDPNSGQLVHKPEWGGVASQSLWQVWPMGQLVQAGLPVRAQTPDLIHHSIQQRLAWMGAVKRPECMHIFKLNSNQGWAHIPALFSERAIHFSHNNNASSCEIGVHLDCI